MNDEANITSKLRQLEGRVRPTDAQRRRVEADMWRLYNDLTVSGSTTIEPAVVVPDRRFRYRRLAIAAVIALLVCSAATIAAIVALTNDDSPVRVEAVDTPDPSVTDTINDGEAATDDEGVDDGTTPLTAADVGTVVQPGRYVVVLDGTEMRFDLDETRIVETVQTDVVVLAPIAGTEGSTPRRLTVAVADNAFDRLPATEWLAAQPSIIHTDNGAVIDGDRAADIEIDVGRPDCEPLSPCVAMAVTPASVTTISLIEGNNRLLVFAVDDTRSLLILDTSGGNRSGASQSTYNTVVASITVQR